MYVRLITAFLNSSEIIFISVIIILTAVIISINNHKNNAYWQRKNVTVARMPSMFAILIKKLPIHQLEQELVNKYGKIFVTHHLGKPTLFCADPELISRVLTKDFTSFPNRRSISSSNELSEHILPRIKDEKWKRIRSIVTPAFSSAKLKKMIPTIDECSQKLIDDINHLITNSNEMDIKKVFGAFALNVIASVAFGVKLDALSDENNPIIANARTYFNFDFGLIDSIKFVIQNRSLRVAKLLGLNNLKRDESKFFTDLALKIIEERKSNKTDENRVDFLHLLLEALENKKETENSLENEGIYEEYNFKSVTKSMSLIEIAAQCVIFFVGGYDTTTATLSHCAYNLACNSHIQHHLYEEAKLVLENKGKIDYDLINNNLKYTDAVIYETLRIFPPARSITREASKDYILGENGVNVSKGDIIHIPIYAIHNHPDYFPDPEKFKPQRFFPENRSHHPYAYIPFGAGPRNCVARRLALIELKLALLYSVYNFRFSVTDKTEHPPKHSLGLHLTPKSIWLNVEKRCKQ